METLKEKYSKKSPLRADKYLAKQIDRLSRADIQRFIAAGKLYINGRPVTDKACQLEAGDEISFTYDLQAVEAVPGKLVVRFETAELLVMEKPVGVVVFPTRKGKQISLAGMVKAKYPELESVGEEGRFGIAHRLDKDTSGLMLAARTDKAYEYLKHLFAKRQIRKEYLALVYGRIKRHGAVAKPLTKIGQRGRSRVRVDESGKEAKTEYWLEQVYTDGLDEYSLLKVELHTGRTHQIRVHMAEIGHPVMGDKLYGKPESLELKKILKRQFLHAFRLEFQDPDGVWIEIESKLPEDLCHTLKQLKKKT